MWQQIPNTPRHYRNTATGEELNYYQYIKRVRSAPAGLDQPATPYQRAKFAREQRGEAPKAPPQPPQKPHQPRQQPPQRYRDERGRFARQPEQFDRETLYEAQDEDTGPDEEQEEKGGWIHAIFNVPEDQQEVVPAFLRYPPAQAFVNRLPQYTRVWINAEGILKIASPKSGKVEGSREWLTVVKPSMRDDVQGRWTGFGMFTQVFTVVVTYKLP